MATALARSLPLCPPHNPTPPRSALHSSHTGLGTAENRLWVVCEGTADREPQAGGLAQLRSGLKRMRTLGPCQVRWLSRPHLTGGGSSPRGSSQPPIPPAVPAPDPQAGLAPYPPVLPSRPPEGGSLAPQ